MIKGGANSGGPTDAEAYQYERSVGTYFSLIYSAYMQHERGSVDDEVWDAFLNALARHMRAPGFSVVWTRIGVGYPKSFQALIEWRFAVSSIAKDAA